MTNDPYAFDDDVAPSTTETGSASTEPPRADLEPEPVTASPDYTFAPPSVPNYDFQPYQGAPEAQDPYGRPAFGFTPAPQPYQPYGMPVSYHQPAVPVAGFPAGAPMAAMYGSRPLIDDPNGPDAPLYGATPVEAFKRFWMRGLTFTGRASRSEYWWMVAIQAGVFLGSALTAAWTNSSATQTMAGLFLLIFVMASIVPTVALSVRRMHDAGSSGFLYLINLVPYLGPLVFMIMAAQPSKAIGARYDRINGG